MGVKHITLTKVYDQKTLDDLSDKLRAYGIKHEVNRFGSHHASGQTFHVKIPMSRVIKARKVLAKFYREHAHFKQMCPHSAYSFPWRIVTVILLISINMFYYFSINYENLILVVAFIGLYTLTHWLQWQPTVCSKCRSKEVA